MAEPILVAQELKKHFVTRHGVVRAVDGISFEVVPGETVGLVGESGSGKTTAAHCISGIYQVTAGGLWFKGHSIARSARRRSKNLKREIRMVFQDPGSSLNSKRTVDQILSVPLKVHGRMKPGQRRSRTAELLELVGLPAEDYGTKYAGTLGGGERQMVAIARALATDPSLIVLDEPTSALDVSVQAKIITLLRSLQDELGLTYLFITHDLSLMRNVASRVLIMYLGKLCEEAETHDFFQRPEHPYTKMLLSSIPVVTEEEKELKPKRILSRGEIPSPVNIPPGCGFHLRCPVKRPDCSLHDPEMVEVGLKHMVRCHLARAPEGVANSVHVRSEVDT